MTSPPPHPTVVDERSCCHTRGRQRAAATPTGQHGDATCPTNPSGISLPHPRTTPNSGCHQATAASFGHVRHIHRGPTVTLIGHQLAATPLAIATYFRVGRADEPSFEPLLAVTQLTGSMKLENPTLLSHPTGRNTRSLPQM